MANSKLKLYYFDGKCRAEVARIILHAAGKEFEDIRFTYDNWAEYKPLMPFGQCPGLEVDGKMYTQSLALNAYLAREFGFYGKRNLEMLQIDQIIQLIEDFFCKAVDVIHMEDGVDKVKAGVELKDKSPEPLGYLEQLLKENGTGYFVGDRLTLADIAALDVATGFLKDFIELDDRFPLLKKNIDLVKEHDRIGPYVKSRKESEY